MEAPDVSGIGTRGFPIVHIPRAADRHAAFTHLKLVTWLLMALPVPPMALADTQYSRAGNFLGFVPPERILILLHQGL
jgi:hypothetical protein